MFANVCYTMLYKLMSKMFITAVEKKSILQPSWYFIR